MVRRRWPRAASPTRISPGPVFRKLVRRDRRGNKDHALEIELFQCVASQNQVRVMDRIERAAENADLFQFDPFCSHALWPVFRFAGNGHQSYADVMNGTSLGQLILTGVPGHELDSDTAALFKRVQPGGFILFGRNIQSAPSAAEAHRRPARYQRGRADHHDRPGRRPCFATAADRERAAECPAASRQGRCRP